MKSKYQCIIFVKASFLLKHTESNYFTFSMQISPTYSYIYLLEYKVSNWWYGVFNRHFVLLQIIDLIILNLQNERFVCVHI